MMRVWSGTSCISGKSEHALESSHQLPVHSADMFTLLTLTENGTPGGTQEKFTKSS
jgi:hypothetical protein